ncbi:hypothetical protein HPB50_018917 [Hyalomma asiaticum]|uniref:Uncharacterized protein n=1 Tax=Hyalomma asiaticum TaxID=266040 RepID=A0ACB7TKU8_HYAAI|nr:hypothetical protein HPB50_018917 [Hyalomma asiaticum]
MGTWINLLQLTLPKSGSDNKQLSELLAEREAHAEELAAALERLREDHVESTLLLETIQSEKVAASRALSQNRELKRQLEEMQDVFVKLSNDKLELTEQLQKEQHVTKELGERLGQQEEELRELRDQNVEPSTSAPGLTHRRIGGCWARWCGSIPIDMDALQETSMPLQAQPLVPKHQESGAEVNEMDVQVLSHQDSSVETESVAVAECRDSRPWTEDCWQTVLSRRQKKSPVKEQRTASQAADCNNSSSSQPKQGSQVKHGRRPRRRRSLLPLPRENIKVVLRPHKGLVFKDLLGYEIPAAVIDTCHRHFDGISFMLRVRPGSNITIVSTRHVHVAKDLRELNHLTIRGRMHSFNSYVVNPEDVLRGVVHGIPPGTSQADLMANLPACDMGSVHEDQIDDPHKNVTFSSDGGEDADISSGTEAVSRGIESDKLCKKKLKNVPPRKSRAVQPDKTHHPRWFSFDRDSSADLRSRSRSRSRASSRDRTPSAAGKHHKQQKQQQLQQPKELAQQLVSRTQEQDGRNHLPAK